MTRPSSCSAPLLPTDAALRTHSGVALASGCHSEAARASRAWLLTIGTLSVFLCIGLGCQQDSSAGSGTGGAAATDGSTGAGGNGGATSTAGCPDAPAKMATGCNGAQCHSPDTGLPDFATTANLASRLIGVKAVFSDPCNGQTELVNPHKPVTGVLFERLTTTTCGGADARQMPPRDDAPAAQQLNDTERASLVACLKAWLEPQLQ